MARLSAIIYTAGSDHTKSKAVDCEEKMSLFKSKKNRKRVFITSLPKAGTHLLKKSVIELAKLRDRSLFLDNRLGFVKENLAEDPNDSIEVGVDDPRFIKKNIIISHLRSIRNYNLITGHVPYSKPLEEILSELGYICFAIVRDPRDVVISHVNFILKTKDHYLHKYYNNLGGFNKCLMTSICGFSNPVEGLRLRNIAERFSRVAIWQKSAICHFVRFEDLVGERGGGDADIQQKEIVDIASHLGVTKSQRTIKHVSAKIFGGTYTFRKGIIGGWQEKFNYDHKEAFKKVSGDLLIRAGYEKN